MDMKTGMGFGDPLAFWPTNSDQVFVIENHPYLWDYEGLRTIGRRTMDDDRWTMDGGR